MKLDASSEVLIRRYLLGDISEEERDQVETRLMADDAFFQQVNLVEDDLIDEYLDQDLTPKDRKRFEVTFLCAPERQHKLRFAKALHTYVANAAVRRVPGPEPAIDPWWQPIADFLRLQRPALAYPLTAAMLLLLIGGPWTFVRIAGLESQITALKQNRDAGESRLRSLYEDQRAKTDSLAAQLQQQQEKWAAAQAAGESRSGRVPDGDGKYIVDFPDPGDYEGRAVCPTYGSPQGNRFRPHQTGPSRESPQNL